MRLQGLGTRRRPCTSRLNTQSGSTLPQGRRRQVCRQSVGVLEEAPAERTAPPAGVGGRGGGYLCLESIHSDACVHFFAFIDLVKNHPAFLWFSDTSFHLPFQRVTACCLLAALRLQHTHRKNYEIFLWMDMGHWNVALPTTDKINRDRSDCQISTKLSRCDCFWLLIYISACFFSSLFLPTVLFTSLLLIERRRAVGPLGSDPGRSRGTVKWRLRGSSRDRGECRVHQGRGREQLVPANDCAW